MSNDGCNRSSLLLHKEEEDPLYQICLEKQEISQLKVNKIIGTDPHARLWLGEYQGKKVVIRQAESERNDSFATKALIQQTRRLCTLEPLQHPNVTRIFGTILQKTTSEFSVVTEFMDHGNLKSFFTNFNNNSHHLKDLNVNVINQMSTKIKMCLDIAEALVYLKANQLYVKTLSSRKILVNSSLVCKINVFECFDQKNIHKLVVETFGSGNIVWFAPEFFFLGETKNTKIDMEKANIYSFGILMGEIITQISPYQSLIQQKGNTLVDLQIVEEFRKMKQTTVPPHENHPFFQEAPMNVQLLVQRCLSFDPFNRPSAEEVVSILKMTKSQLNSSSLQQ
jgi:serine/threonine protein kinase